MRKVIITAAVVGTRPTKEKNPAVPYTPEEIANAAVDCHKAGAASVHIHVRDPKTGSPAVSPPELQVELYREIVDRIREKCDMIINLSCSKVGLSEPDLIKKRLRPMDLSPDIASVHGDNAFFEAATKKAREFGIKPEIEVFGTQDLSEIIDYVEKGWFDAPVMCQINLGTARGLDATPESLLSLMNGLPENAVWSVMAMDSPNVSPALHAMAVLLGGNIRVGFEDNIFLKEGVLAESNAQLVERAVNLVHQLKHEVATSAEAREMLGIRK